MLGAVPEEKETGTAIRKEKTNWSWLENQAFLRSCDFFSGPRQTSAGVGKSRCALSVSVGAALTVVPVKRMAPSNSVTFGATVRVQDKRGAIETVTIIGVDELNFERHPA